MIPTRTDPTTPARVLRAARLAPVVAWTLAIGPPAPAQASSPAPPPASIIHLAPGGFAAGEPGGSAGFASGELAASDRPGMVRWQSGVFAAPLEFPIDRVASVRFPFEGPAPRPLGALGFELTGGDVLFGSLVALDDKAAELDVARLGKLRVDRARLRRIFRWRDGADLVYSGPNGLAGWREVQPPKPPSPPGAARAENGIVPNGRIMVAEAFIANARPAAQAPAPIPPEPNGPAWREELGQLATEREGAILQGDVALPARASIELELSWRKAPDFSVAIGVDDDEKTVGRAFRLEVWDEQLILLRETDKEGDLASIRKLASGPGRLRLRAFLDQEKGRCLVVSEEGRPLADLTLGGRPGPGLSGLRLANHRGDLRLERVRVGRWDGETPAPWGVDDARVRLVDGSVSPRTIDRFDAAAREFVARDDAGESRIAEDRLAEARLSGPADEAARAVHALYQDGTRIGGSWDGVEGKALLVSAPGVAGALRLPFDGLRSLEMPPRNPAPEPTGDPVGTLDMDGIRIAGHLAGAAGGGLAWKPLGGASASPFRPGASGRIIFQGAPPPATTSRTTTSTSLVAPAPVVVQEEVVVNGRVLVQARAAMQINVGVGAVDAVPRRVEPARPTAAPTSVRRNLYLRTGDIIPSEVTKVDEEGVTIRSDVAESTFVPHARIKAVELAAELGSLIRIDKDRRERLLTLPRMQKGSPPTHLIRSKNGDILRGRLIAMDDRTLRVEVRQREMEVPRDRVSRIIWLHADESDPARKPAEPPGVAAITRVQAVRSDGIRLTFVAEAVGDGFLSGRSDVLGPCKVRLRDLDQLLIGGAVEKEATQLAYQQWRLQDAPEPRSASADAGAGGAAGTESALVGKPAPDFTLDMLSGPKFHLADARGKVVVLDFWATWCGPCLQAMPQVEKVAREFEGKGVQLVAVNLQEAPAQIKPVLERQKLSLAVALDRNGAVAEKYGASAIPQTVIVDREGKVFRLFVGGGPHFDDQLREALQSLIPAEQP